MLVVTLGEKEIGSMLSNDVFAGSRQLTSLFEQR